MKSVAGALELSACRLNDAVEEGDPGVRRLCARELHGDRWDGRSWGTQSVHGLVEPVMGVAILRVHKLYHLTEWLMVCRAISGMRRLPAG